MMTFLHRTVNFVLVACIFSSCNFHWSTANLKDMRVCDAVDSSSICKVNHTEFDGTTKEIFATVQLRNAPESTKVNLIFSYLGADSPIILREDTLYAGQSTVPVFGSILRPRVGWLGGNFEARYIIDDDTSKMLREQFTVNLPPQLSVFLLDSEAIGLHTFETAQEVPVFSKQTKHLYAEAYFSRIFMTGKATVTWYYFNGSSPEQITEFEVDLTNGRSRSISTDISMPDKGWPEGNYAIKISFENAVITQDAIKQFIIQSE